MRSTSLKKAMTTIQKNQSTSKDDIFIKPDPSKVTGMKRASYDKLNERGTAPEETVVENGDIIIGKVSPIQPVGTTNKTFKDSSEVYKSHIPGTIDRVWDNIYNHEGYEMRKMRVRSERTPQIGDKVCCFLADHEILTDLGWIKINEVTYKHKIACLINGENLEYHYPVDIQEYDYSGKLYTINSKHVNLKVTSNHRMYVADREGKRYSIQYAEDIFGKARKYIKNVNSFKPTDSPADTFKIDTLELPMTAWLEFFGIWIAEGCITDRSVSFAAHKQRVKDKLTECCAKMNLHLTYYKDKQDADDKNIWCVHNTVLAKYFEPFNVGAVNKFLPAWVWQLTRDQCKTLIGAMVLGDGHYMKGTSTVRYDTSSIKLRDDLQRLCLHAGYSANWYLKYEKGHTTEIKSRNNKKLLVPESITSTVDAFRLTIITTQNNPIVNKNIKQTGENRQDAMEDYNGKVYCCTVPGDGVIYVRLNGKPVWCGNSRHGRSAGKCQLDYKLASLLWQAILSNCEEVLKSLIQQYKILVLCYKLKNKWTIRNQATKSKRLNDWTEVGIYP